MYTLRVRASSSLTHSLLEQSKHTSFSAHFQVERELLKSGTGVAMLGCGTLKLADGHGDCTQVYRTVNVDVRTVYTGLRALARLV
jgi:hypothetical protein